MTYKIKSFDFSSPVRIVFGSSVLNRIGEFSSNLGKKALIVTGSGAVDCNMLELELSNSGIAYDIFRVTHEPDMETIIHGVDMARANHNDMVISLGGGSVMDAGKAIAAMVTNPGEVIDYMEVVGGGKSVNVPGIPMIAIPTTAGTGSEVTKNAVISHPEKHVKVSMRGNGMYARVALIDPQLTISLPKSQTASTGMDALTQVIEAYLSKNANAYTDAIALEGISRGARHLFSAYRDGNDLEARENMSFTSLLSGIALANAGLGAVHGFAGVVGGMVSAAHGALCACFLPAVLRTNLAAINHLLSNEALIEKFVMISKLVTGNAQAEPYGIVEWIETLLARMQIKKLKELGVNKADFPEIIAKAKTSSSMQKNPVVLTEQELMMILEASW